MERKTAGKKDLLLIFVLLLIAAVMGGFFLLQDSDHNIAALSIDGRYVELFDLKKEENQLIDLRAFDDGDNDPSNDVKIPYDDPMWELLLDQLSFDETVDFIRDAFHGRSAIESVQSPGTRMPYRYPDRSARC